MEDDIKINTALNLIYEYGSIDGGHHQKWLVDQILRTLTGDDYTKWVKDFQSGEDGDDTYEWDKGIAP